MVKELVNVTPKPLHKQILYISIADLDGQIIQKTFSLMEIIVVSMRHYKKTLSRSCILFFRQLCLSVHVHIAPLHLIACLYLKHRDSKWNAHGFKPLPTTIFSHYISALQNRNYQLVSKHIIAKAICPLIDHLLYMTFNLEKLWVGDSNKTWIWNWLLIQY